MAEITTPTGQGMSLSQTAISAMSFWMERRENLLTETDKDALSTDSTLVTRKKPVKRKLAFADLDSPHMLSNLDSSPIIINDIRENSPCSHDNKDHEQLQNSHTGSDCTDSADSPIPPSLTDSANVLVKLIDFERALVKATRSFRALLKKS